MALKSSLIQSSFAVLEDLHATYKATNARYHGFDRARVGADTWGCFWGLALTKPEESDTKSIRACVKPEVCRTQIFWGKCVCLLTGYSVDGFERSEYTHCSNGGEVDVLDIKGVFNYPEKKKQTEEISVTVTRYRQTECYFCSSDQLIKAESRQKQKRVEFKTTCSPVHKTNTIKM